MGFISKTFLVTVFYLQIEGAMGYAHWVCSLLLDTERQTSEVYQYAIHQMAAIPAASDALARYTGELQNAEKRFII